MVDRKLMLNGADFLEDRRKRSERARLEHLAETDTIDFELGDGSELDLSDPDVGFALSMANPHS